MHTSTKAWLWIDDITSFAVKLQYSIPSPLREITAIQDQVERYQVTFIEPNGCNFDVSADESVTHCGMRPSQVKFGQRWAATAKVTIAWAGLFAKRI
jgi:hypothetical protein